MTVMRATYPADWDARIAEEEELVHAGNDNGPYQPNNPGAQGGDRHSRIVGISDRRADLWVGGVVLWQVDEHTSAGTRA